jgi:hypothetical protein
MVEHKEGSIQHAINLRNRNALKSVRSSTTLHCQTGLPDSPAGNRYRCAHNLMPSALPGLSGLKMAGTQHGNLPAKRSLVFITHEPFKY